MLFWIRFPTSDQFQIEILAGELPLIIPGFALEACFESPNTIFRYFREAESKVETGIDEINRVIRLILKIRNIFLASV